MREASATIAGALPAQACVYAFRDRAVTANVPKSWIRNEQNLVLAPDPVEAVVREADVRFIFETMSGPHQG